MAISLFHWVWGPSLLKAPFQAWGAGEKTCLSGPDVLGQVLPQHGCVISHVLLHHVVVWEKEQVGFRTFDGLPVVATCGGALGENWNIIKIAGPCMNITALI